jgi:cytidylate kinase
LVMPPASVIAIDGPAASGKSTLACALAERLGYLYFDTGVMYRAVTLMALELGIPIGDESAISDLAQRLDIDVQPALGQDPPYRVVVNGESVTEKLRTQAVDSHVSEVSTYRSVRAAMTRRQREIGERGQVIMVGRDIGTVVLPEADLKIYLEASVEARARRRWQELEAHGDNVKFDEVLASMQARDEIDSSRELAPLKAADDAVRLDNTSLSIAETVEKVASMVAGAG